MPVPHLTNEIEEGQAGGQTAKMIGLFAGLAVFATMIGLGGPTDLSPKAWLTLAVLAVMIIWWVTEALPVAVTSLLPLAALPVLGIAKPVDAAAPYADPIIFLFIGGFMIAAAIELSGLHRRIALRILMAVGSSPAAIVLGFMIATTLLSMWISNTATTMMMVPIAIAVCTAASDEGLERRKLIAACVLGVAYSASIGGLGTPIGTPTNLIGVKWLEANDVALSFPQWIGLGSAVILIMIPFCWFMLTKVVYRLSAAGHTQDAHGAIVAQAQALGVMTSAEKRVLIVFIAVAALWIAREPLTKIVAFKGLSDMVIAVLGAIALFIIPAGPSYPRGQKLLDWTVAERIPWGITLLFGGGLSMAAAMEATGVSIYIGSHMTWLGSLPILLTVLILVAVTVFVSELASNVAALTAILPVLTAIVVGSGADPLLVGLSATFAASFGFMLPVATAANAIAYATGAPRQIEMIRVGFALNLVGIIMITLVIALIGPLVRGS